MKNNLYPKAIFELRPSKIIPNQVGLFALINFNRGDIIVENSNWDESRLIRWNDFEKLNLSTKRQLIYFCYKTKKGIYAPQNINKINIAYFMNHSCNPCTYCNTKGDYVVKRNIKKGEELTIDVEDLMEKPTFPFKCKCNSSKCRKTVKI